MGNHRFFLGILAAYILLAGTYSIVNPLFESPDEVWHYEYVRWLVEGNGLAAPEDVGHAPWHQEGSQPPLYYIAAAALTAWIPTDNAASVIQYNPHAAVGQADSFGNKNVMVHGQAEAWPWRGAALAAHVARFFSILLGAVTVWATYATARLFAFARSSSGHSSSGRSGVEDNLSKDMPRDNWVALVAASIVAFNPQFIFLTAAVNNDNLVTCISAVGVWFGLRLVQNALIQGALVQEHDELVTVLQTFPEAQNPIVDQRNGSSSGGFLSRLLRSFRETELLPMEKRRPPTDLSVALFGAIAGLAALSKLSGLLLSLFVALTLAAVAWERRSVRLLIRWGLISGVSMMAVSGWWYLRNWLLFGDPLALSAMFDILPRRAEPPTLDELVARAEGIWNSVWAVFGWFNVVVDPQLYWFYSGLTLLGLAGFVALVATRIFSERRLFVQPLSNPMPDRRGSLIRPTWLQLGLLLIWITMLVLSLWRWAQMRYPQGRLLFPALSATAVVLALGLNQWLPQRTPTRVRSGVFVSLMGVLLLIATAVPWLYIVPSYQPAQQAMAGASDVDLAGAESTSILDATGGADANTGSPALSVPDVAFGDLIQLERAHLSDDEIVPGDRLTLTLTWRALQPIGQNLSVFVHLIDENEILQAQRDSYPGQGNLPTSEWQPDMLTTDQHVVEVPLTAPSPSRLKVNIGLYDFASGTRLLINGSDHWTLGFVRLAPPAGDGTLPNSVFVNFEEKIALVGFEFDRYVLAPGDTLILKLWWEALDAPLRDIKVFAHLVLPPEATWAQDDDRPRAGTAKTDTWQLGDRIEDQYEMTLPNDAPNGVYFVEIGLYDGESYKRLKVNFSDKGTVIGQVRVAE